MQARRTRYLWLSRQDHLPRKIKEIVRGAETRVTVEEWSDVKINAEIPPNSSPGRRPRTGSNGTRPSWRIRFCDPDKRPRISCCGQRAEARSGCRIIAAKSSGSTCGTQGRPSAGRRIRGLQQLHQTYKDEGLAILGCNCTDDGRIARAFLKANGVTFPSVLDASETATRLMRKGLRNKAGIMPLNYIIDPQGAVVDGWFGQDQDPERVLAAFKAAGLALAQ